MSDYNLVEAIIEETYKIERKTIQGFFSSKIVETEDLICKEKKIYEDGEIVKKEKIKKQYDGELERTISIKCDLDSYGNHCWEHKTKNENGDLLCETVYYCNEKGDYYKYSDHDYKYSSSRLELRKLTYDSKGNLIHSKISRSYYGYSPSNYKYEEKYEYNSKGEIIKYIEHNLADNSRTEIHYTYEDGKKSTRKKYYKSKDSECLKLVETILYIYEDALHPDYNTKAVIIRKDGTQDVHRFERSFDSNGFQIERRLYVNSVLTEFWKAIIIYK